MGSRELLGWLVLTCVSVSPTQGQDKPAASPADARLTTLLFTVLNKKDQLVADLSRDEIRVLEEKQEQRIEQFSPATTLPLRLGVLIDASGSRANQLPGVEKNGARQLFLSVVRRDDSAFVARFSGESEIVTDFTNDRERLTSAITSATETPPYGPSILLDAIHGACFKLQQQPGRRILVVVTDGIDNGSKHSLDQVVSFALESSTAVYIVQLPGSIKRQLHRATLDMETLARETGGDRLTVGNEKGALEAFQYIAAAFKSQYQVVFQPTSPTRNGRFRKIKIEVRRPGVKVLAPKGYYAPKD